MQKLNFANGFLFFQNGSQTLQFGPTVVRDVALLGLDGAAAVAGHVDEVDAALLPLRALGRDAAPFRISLNQFC